MRGLGLEPGRLALKFREARLRAHGRQPAAVRSAALGTLGRTRTKRRSNDVVTLIENSLA